MKYYQLFVFSVLSFITYVNSEIRFVWKLISEGAKSPYTIDSNNLDLFSEEWTTGAGVLTEVGYRMHYLLGTKDKSNYEDFISESYDPSEIYVRAGEYNTTVMSASAYLTGLFPPGVGPELTPAQRALAYPGSSNKNFGDFDEDTFGSYALPNGLQVVPIHVFDNYDKKYFFMKFELCNNAVDNFEDNMKEDDIEADLETFQNTYGSALMQILSISDIDDFLNYEYVYNICNNFIADYVQGKTLKSFTDNGISLTSFNETCTTFHTTDLYEIRAGYSTDNFLPRAVMSSFKDEILMWMDNRVDNDNNDVDYVEYTAPKLVVFSVPDYAIASMIAYISKEKGIDTYAVPSASSFAFELYNADGTTIGNDLSNDDYNVDVNFNGVVIATYSYTEFRDMIDGAWNEDTVRDECANDLVEKYGYKRATIACGVLLGVFFVLFVIVFLAYRKKKGSSGDYDNKVSQTAPKETTENVNDNKKNKEEIKVGDEKEEKAKEEDNLKA